MAPLHAPPGIKPKAKKKKPVKKSKLIAILSSCAAVLIIGIVLIVYFVIQAGKASDYDNATILMEEGKYSQAQEIFTDLGTYKDSYALAIECQNIINYNAAKQFMDNGRYPEAKIAFDALGSFRDSRDLAVECQKGIDYDRAVELLSIKEYAAAKRVFDDLIPYKDSALHANECGNRIAYAEALDLMSSGDYQGAVIKLEPLVEQNFEDSSYLIEECLNEIYYSEAVELMGSGRYDDAIILLEPLAIIEFRDSLDLHIECNNNIVYARASSAYSEQLFYTAYKLFRSIPNFRDSRDRASACVQTLPETGQTYRNSEYSGTAVSLRITTPRSDTRPTFLKIYTASGVHVSSVFIRSGGSPTIRLPVGTYKINMAFGENWFGPDEMFGDDNAYYQVLILGGGNETTYTFQQNYNYTLTLRDAEGGNVPTQNTGRDGM